MQGNLNELLKNLPPELARTVARYGVRLAIDLLETFYSDLAGERAPARPAGKKRGRPPAKLPVAKLAATRAVAAKSGWSDDPEERSREVKRRQEVARAKKAAEKLSVVARKRWDKMSAAQKQERLRSMARGRKRAAKHAKPDEEATAA